MKLMKIMVSFILLMSLFACQTLEDEVPTEIEDPTTVIESEQPFDFNLPLVDVYAYTFWNQLSNTLPIGVWSDPPPKNFAGIYQNPDLINDEQYQLISEAGVNTVYGLFNNFALNRDDVIKSLDLSEKYGISYIVRDSQVTGSYDDDDFDLLKTTLDHYKDHPAFGGSMIVDEPGVTSFNNLSNLHKNYRSLLPQHAYYINMLPNYASKNQLVNGASGGTVNDDSITYERYMREYIEKVKPEFYSYDFYPFVGLEYARMRRGYFDQMTMIRDISNEYEIPFWTFIQASSWSPSSLRVPNQTEVSWQVSTSIAMGAKGIQYFMYYTSMEQGRESFVGGMVDINGNKNPMYDYVKHNNLHLINIQDVIMRSAQVGVIVHGDSPDDIPQSIQLEGFSVLNQWSGDDMIIGAFNHMQKPAYYVVNNSLTKMNGNHTLTFDQVHTMKVYEGETSRVVTTQSLNLSIAAGEGVLIEILS